jgi:hypothetical protein
MKKYYRIIKVGEQVDKWTHEPSLSIKLDRAIRQNDGEIKAYWWGVIERRVAIGEVSSKDVDTDNADCGYFMEIAITAEIIYNNLILLTVEESEQYSGSAEIRDAFRYKHTTWITMDEFHSKHLSMRISEITSLFDSRTKIEIE